MQALIFPLPHPPLLVNLLHLLKLFLQIMLSDPWHFLHPTGREYSFFSHVHSTYSRTDDFFMDNSFLSNLSIIFSDQSPLVLLLAFSQIQILREKHRRLDPLSLRDEHFLAHISALINFFFSTNVTGDVSSKTVWERRGEIISFVVSAQGRN